MEQFKQLLDLQNSELSKFLEFGLYGLRASLLDARNKLPNDPGVVYCDEAIAELEALLEIQKSEQVFKTSPNPQPEDEPEPVSESLQLGDLQQEFTQNPDLINYLGEKYSLKSNTDSELWQEINLLLLRVPEELAKSKQELALEIAKNTGAKKSEAAKKMIEIPYSRDEVIYPGLMKNIEAKGLRFSTTASLDPRLTKENLTGEILELGKIVSTCLKLIELDWSNLYHAFETVYRFGLIPLSKKEQREKYINALISCFERVQKSDPDLVLAMRSRIALDEAIHSLIYQPLAHQESWWAKLQYEARKKLKSFSDSASKDGHDVSVLPLSGSYADVFNKYSKDDIIMDNGGIQGEILTCLRVYARVEDTKFPGRVLYRA